MKLNAIFCHRPAALGDPAALKREQMYSVWKQIYKQAHEEQGQGALFFSDAFLRYDVVLGVWKGESLVGSSSFGFFDFASASARDHSYARNLLADKAQKELEVRRIWRVMTFESFFIAPEYREHKNWLAALITELGLEFYHGERARQALDAAVTVARVSKKMHAVAENSGFELICDDLFYNGEAAALLLYTREEKRPPADAECRVRLRQLNITHL